MSMKLAESGVEMIQVLADTIESWDLVISDDEPFPPTVENIMQLPIELATLIARKITGGAHDDGEASLGEAEGSFADG
jgi:hypothetical protein